ncbi:hypothetical protein ABZP36_001575 [Zizania latifolia]
MDRGRLFSGVRFALLGFDPVSESHVSPSHSSHFVAAHFAETPCRIGANLPQFLPFGFYLTRRAPCLQYRSEMVRRGAADAGGYGADCTHLVVCGLLYDDPVCVVARKDGKKLVSTLWVDDSLNLGEVADADRVLYRPMRDFNGVPGSESLCIFFTGYQKNGREDIMKMVTLMGAQFSKPLIVHKITHLVCYKFEGEKYKLAKRVKINLVNHQWLEDWYVHLTTYLKSKDEEEASGSSSASKCVTRSTHATEIRMATLVDPGIQAPTQAPTISSEQIKKAGGSSKRSLNIKSDMRNTPKTTGLTISAGPDAHESVYHSLVLNGKEEVPEDQVNRDEANDDVKKALGISPGACSTPNIGGTTVCVDHHVHQLTTMPAMSVDNTENIDGNCLDSTNQNNVSSALWSAPSKEKFSEKALQSSDTSEKAGKKDVGSTPDLNAAVHQSNAEQKPTLCEVNLRLTGNAASKNTQVLSYSRKRCQKSVSPEGNLKSATASPQSFERINPRVEFCISPSRKSDHKISDLTDAESLRDDEVVKKVDKSGVLAQRTYILSSISPKPSNGSSATGTASSPFSSRKSASEGATVSGLNRNSTQSVILTGKEKSGSFKSNSLSYRRTSLKLVRLVEGQKLPESSTDGRESLRENTLALSEARSEKGCAASSSSNSEVEKSSSFSLQNGDTEMNDAPQVNKTEVVGPHTDSENMVSHQNLEAISKEIQVTVITNECGTFPQEGPTSKVKNARAKRLGFLIFSNKAATSKSLKSKDEIVSSKSNHDKVISCEYVEAKPEKNHASPNGAECAVFFPEEISNSKANNVAAKSSLDASSEVNSELALSNTESAEKNMGEYSKRLLCSVIADEHQIGSFQMVPNAIARNTVAKASQTADADVSVVNNTRSVSSELGFKEVCHPENAESCPNRLSSDTKMDDPETCTPNIVQKNRVRKAVCKRRVVSSLQQNSFGVEPCKNGNAFVSEVKFVYLRRASESSKNASKATVDQSLQNSNDDGAKDAGGSYFKDIVPNRVEIFQNSKARSSKRQKAADLVEGSTDHDKENLPTNSNVVSKSKYGKKLCEFKMFC